jgi:hypothetical protein
MSPSESLALIRIEHKLDLILESLSTRDPVLAALLNEGTGLSAYSGDVCPTCLGDVRIISDLTTETYTRTCDCKPNMPIVVGIKKLNEGVPAKKTPTTTPDQEEDPHAES